MNLIKSKSDINPIVYLAYIFIFIVLVFQIEIWKQAIWLFSFLVIVLYKHRKLLQSIFKRVRPFLFFLPVMVLLYMLFSVILVESASWRMEIFYTALVSGGKLLIMVIAMSVFLELIDPSDLMDAFRFFWLKTGLKWRWVEDFFQLIYLTLRFFPTFQEEVNNNRNFKKALGLPEPAGKIEMIKQTALYLPNLISNSMHRATNLGFAMEVRGYGKVIPRGIAKSYSLRFIDFVAFIVLFVFSLEFFLLV